MREDYVARARALVGSRFRPQGRVLELGIDCVGLVIAAYALPDSFPRNYRLRGDHYAVIRAQLNGQFRRVSPRSGRLGDLCLWQVAADQFHFGVDCGASFVHADARIGKIVETPKPAPGKLRGIYRRRVRPAKKV